MKKAYENPVAEKIVFDYSQAVVASGATQYKSTKDHRCDIILEEPPVVHEPTTGPIILCKYM